MAGGAEILSMATYLRNASVKLAIGTADSAIVSFIISTEDVDVEGLVHIHDVEPRSIFYTKDGKDLWVFGTFDGCA